MQISSAAIVLILGLAGGTGYVQASSSPMVVAGQAQTAAPVTTPSSLLRPSLTVVQNTLTGLKLDKWKKGSVRDEAGANVSSLLKDLQTNLPPLLTVSDALPGQLSTGLPLVKHLDAFYDVLLRVEEASRVTAPGDQVAALQQAMLQLNQSRLLLDDYLQGVATSQEKQVGDLQGALKTARAAAEAKPVAVAPVPCKPVAPAKKKAAKKPAAPGPAKPAAAPSATPAKPGAGQPQQQPKTQ